MKKTALTALIVLILMAVIVVAAKPADTGKAHHLYLYEKMNFCYDATGCDGVTDPWAIVADGAWGKLMYKDTNDKFVFNGHGLDMGVDYILLSYAEGYPGVGSVVLGTGMANEYGNIHIDGFLPQIVTNDYTGFDWGDYTSGSGAKIWLVLADDFGTQFTAWNPTEYLFENNLI